MKPLKHLPAWKALEQHFKAMRSFDMRTAFHEDARRFEHLSLRCGNLLLDYSKNRITADTMSQLMQLARESELEALRNAMFSGERINFTENRAVLHTALRAPVRPPRVVEGVDVDMCLRLHVSHVANKDIIRMIAQSSRLPTVNSEVDSKRNPARSCLWKAWKS